MIQERLLLGTLRTMRWALLALVALLGAASADDRITSLPGLAQMPPFAMYSGYVSIEGTPQNLFYWFVESASNPAEDPLVLWMNGGPGKPLTELRAPHFLSGAALLNSVCLSFTGCSSMLGLLTEHGPLRVQDDGQTLLPNQFSWNAHASIIYVEAPSGVGFSYGTNNNYTTGDNDTAAHNLEFLFGWMDKYPQFSTNPFVRLCSSSPLPPLPHGHSCYPPSAIFSCYQTVRGRRKVRSVSPPFLLLLGFVILTA